MVTCSVKGRPGCKVECQHKCYAYFPEPFGPCTAGCRPPAGVTPKIKPEGSFSACIGGFSGSDVLAVFDLPLSDQFRTRLMNSSAVFNLEVSNVTAAEFVQELLRTESEPEPVGA